MYKLNNLILVNKDNDMVIKANEIKEVLESEDIRKICENILKSKIEKNNVEFQGSYKRHTASYNIKKTSSDIDIILYIAEYQTSNDIQYMKDPSLKIYSSNFSKKIINQLKVNSYIKDDSFRDLSLFVKLKKEIYLYLKKIFSEFNVENSNKCIKMWNNKFNFDIVVAGKWTLELNNYKIIGSNIIINNYPFEIQNLPNLNIEKIEEKAKKCMDLYNYIRFFKNVNKINGEIISSYFVECLLYNVPNCYYQKYINKDTLINICSFLKTNIYDVYNWKEIHEINEVFILNKKISIDSLDKFINVMKKFINEDVIYE